MKIHWMPVLAAALGLATAAAFQSGEPVEGLGACAISPEKVDCWDMSGSRSHDLSEMIAARLEQQSPGYLQFGFGKPIRYLVLRIDQGVSLNFRASQRLHTVSIQMEDSRIQLSPVTVQDDNATASYDAVAYDYSNGSSILLPPRRGADADLDSGKIRLADWKKVKTPDRRTPSAGLGNTFGSPYFWNSILPWSYALFFEGDFDSYESALRYEALDSRGVPIAAVDASNRPASKEEFSKWIASDNKGRPFEIARFERQFDNVATAWSVRTNVDPASIANLRVTKPAEIRVHIDFPLNPR